MPIPSRLPEDVEDVTGLIHGAPQVLLATLESDERLVEMPRVSEPATSAPQSARILRTEPPTPFPDGLIGDFDTPAGHQVLHVSTARSSATTASWSRWAWRLPRNEMLRYLFMVVKNAGCVLFVLGVFLVLTEGRGPAAVQGQPSGPRTSAGELPTQVDEAPGRLVEPAARSFLRGRYEADLAAVAEHRPGHPFWQHVFVIPDGRIIFGSGADGRLLASFSAGGDWSRDGVWYDSALRNTLDGARLPSRMGLRRDRVSELLEPLISGPVIHNATRGLSVASHAERYARFLEQWGAIYERFGVPAEIGLAQALIESGLDGRARSYSDALGFCQWLRGNWNHLDRHDPNVIEVYNQTTQASYCAAHLIILATMYGSFIPALSEHHAGGTNVGRTVINGIRLGGTDVREQYFLGSRYARDLRAISISRYRELFRTYGPRSFLYSEMVFGNATNIARLMAGTRQVPIFAMRASRSLSLAEVREKSGLSTDEVKRFNPALVRRVQRGANVYLPSQVEEFGPDVSFWRRPPPAEFVAVLDEFVRLDPGVERWHDPAFETTLLDFQRRFAATATEEGTVMVTTLRYIGDALRRSRRAKILAEFRTSDHIDRLFQQGLAELRATTSGN